MIWVDVAVLVFAVLGVLVTVGVFGQIARGLEHINRNLLQLTAAVHVLSLAVTRAAVQMAQRTGGAGPAAVQPGAGGGQSGEAFAGLDPNASKH